MSDEQVVDNVVVIDGTSYTLAPLQMRHLREISTLLQNVESAKGGIIGALDRWMPYIRYSLKKNNPDFKDEMLDELTLEQFTEVWYKVTKVSGVTFTEKGEQKPKAVSTSTPSTGASAPLSAGPTLQ